MYDDDLLIKKNLSAIKAHALVRGKMVELGGDWKLNIIHHIHGMPKNVEFGMIFDNDTNGILVMGKIHRTTEKLSITKVEER